MKKYIFILFLQLIGCQMLHAQPLEMLRSNFLKSTDDGAWERLTVAVLNSESREKCWYSAVRYAWFRNVYLFPNSHAVADSNTPGESQRRSEEEMKKELATAHSCAKDADLRSLLEAAASQKFDSILSESASIMIKQALSE